MKKTVKMNVMTKILVAVMAAAMMIGTAAGCQGNQAAAVPLYDRQDSIHAFLRTVDGVHKRFTVINPHRRC